MLQLTVTSNASQDFEVIAALFSGIFSEGVQVEEDHLLAYASEEEFKANESILAEWKSNLDLIIEVEKLAHINWNEEWEKNFDPVIVEDILTIKAGFHDIQPTTRFTIDIQPKMSFGTGHHATTYMMVKMMSLLDFDGKTVLDAGSGTGILGILASMWNASKVIGFDNDEWSYENALENQLNNPTTGHIEFRNGTLSIVEESKFDIVLANINKNFLLDEGGKLSNKVKSGGYLIISGFYDVDSKALLDRFEALNLVAQYLQIRDEWACIALKAGESDE